MRIMSLVQRLARSVALLIFSAVAILALSSTPKAHPHDEPEIFDVKGTLTKVDLVNQVVEVDTIDSKTKARRNLLLFVDRKAKISNGKTRMALGELQPGQRVTCAVERKHQEGREDRERLTVFQIRLDARS